MDYQTLTNLMKRKCLSSQSKPLRIILGLQFFSSISLTLFISLLLLSHTIEGRKTNGRLQYRTETACEGSTLKITCEPGTVINLIRANFGRFSIQTCNDNGNLEWNVECMSKKSFRVMEETCGMKRSCQLLASIVNFDDPCPGTRKYLEAHYQCVPLSRKHNWNPSTTRVSLPVNKPVSRAPENNSINLLKSSQDKQNLDSKSETKLFQTEAIVENNSSTIPIVTIQLSSSPPFSQSSPSSTISSLPSSISSTTTTTSSTTTSTQPSKNLEKWTFNSDSKVEDIYIKHPHPGLHSTSKPSVSADSNLDNSNIINSSSSNHSSLLFHLLHPLAPTPLTHCSPTFSRNLFWDWTQSGQFVSQSCPTGSKGFAKWLCSNDTGLPQWTPTAADLSDCVSNAIISLEERLNDERESILNLASELAEMTTSSVLYAKDLYKISDIIIHLITRTEIGISEFPDQRKNRFVTDILTSIQQSLSNLLEDKLKEAWSDLLPYDRRHSANQVIAGLQKAVLLFGETRTEAEDFIRPYNNIYIGVYNLIKDNSQFKVSGNDETNEDFKGQDLDGFSKNSVLISSKTWDQITDTSKIALVSFKKLDTLLSPDSDKWLPRLNYLQNYSTVINSDIVSVIVGNDIDAFPLISPGISIVFEHRFLNNFTNPECVYWSVGDNDWSSHGCKLISTNQTHSQCECNRLYIHALLVTTGNFEPSSVTTFEISFIHILAYLSCIINIFCYTLTLVTFLFFKHLKTQSRTIHLNLSFCLLIIQLQFIISFGFANIGSLCRILVTFLHYFSLSALFWIFTEGIQLLMTLNDHLSKNRNHWFFLSSYGIPLLIFAFSVFWEPFSFQSSNCLLWANMLVKCFVASLILSNILLLLLSVHLMNKYLKLKDKLNHQENIANIRTWLKRSLVLIFLLGSTWTFGLMYLNKSVILTGLLFALFNTLLGLFVFFIYSLSDEKTRQAYFALFRTINSKLLCSNSIGQAHTSIKGDPLGKRSNYIFSTSASAKYPTESAAHYIQDPIIAPNSGSSLNSMFRKMDPNSLDTRYFLTAQRPRVENEKDMTYGCSQLLNRLKSNSGNIRIESSLYPTPNGLFVEHVYECIDDEPYTAKLFVPIKAANAAAAAAAVSTLNETYNPNRENSIYDGNFTKTNENNVHSRYYPVATLPAIVRDNTRIKHLVAPVNSNYRSYSVNCPSYSLHNSTNLNY